MGAPTSPPEVFSFKKANTYGGPPSLNRLGNLAGVVINQSNASYGFDPVTRFHLEETMQELALGSNSKFKLTPGCEWLLEKAGSRREGVEEEGGGGGEGGVVRSQRWRRWRWTRTRWRSRGGRWST